MKQSVGLVILQFFGITLGLVSVFWIAGSVPADVYAIVGIYQVISSIVSVFSNTGLETHAIRNVLAWKEIGEHDMIKQVVTQSIACRTLLATLIFIPLIGYAFYISKYKFGNQYFGLFVLMALLSIARAINDSIILILKAFNKYLAAAFVSYTVNVFGRLFALFLFIKYGFEIYINTIIFLPLITTLPVFFMIRKWIKISSVFNKVQLIDNLKISKSFALSAYVSYLFNFFDQLIVSIFLSPEVMGSFTIGKRLVFIAKTFIENIFDPLIQNLVRYKSKIDIFSQRLAKIFKIRNFLILLSLVILPVIIVYIDEALLFFRLGHYPYLNYFLVTVFISQIALICMKVKYNFIALFYSSDYYLKLTVINAAISILFFIILVVSEVKYVFLYIGLTNLIMMFYTSHLYKKKNPLMS